MKKSKGVFGKQQNLNSNTSDARVYFDESHPSSSSRVISDDT